MRILFVAVLIFVSSIASNANADLAIAIGNADGQTTPILVNAGNQVVVPFLATPSVTTNLSGYNLSIEFGQSDDGGGNGSGLGGNFEPSNFSLSEIPGEFTGTLAFSNDSAGPVFYVENGIPTNYDFLVNHNGSTQSFQADETFGLFNLLIDVPNNAIPGIYDVRLELSDQPGGDNANAPGNVGFSVVQGSILVAAVPEPSSGLFLTAGYGLVVLRRRRS